MKTASIQCVLVMLLMITAVVGSCQHFAPFFLNNGNSHQYNGGIYGCGATFSDFDKDGFDDLSLPTNGSNPIFYKNINGEMIQISLGIQNQDELKHLVWVDYDNDGDRDLCMTGIGMPVRLFNNAGAMNLTEVSLAAGFPVSADMTYGNSWGDYDRDGDLDVFIAKYDAAYTGMTNADNELYRNNGDGTFTNVADEAGIYFETNYTFMGLWMDYDNDLWPDLLITNDRTEAPNYLFHNNGDGTFSDVSQETGVKDFIWSMSNTSDDYDNDGDVDLYITNGPLGNTHKRNDGNIFSDVTIELNTAVNRFCWSAQFLDADNDGWLDLHVCSTPISTIPGGVVFLKNHQYHFADSTLNAGLSLDAGWSRGSAIGDMNNDGFPDIVVTKTAPSFSSFWQSVPNGNHWMKVNLDGVLSNEDGIGSRIELFADDKIFSRYTHCGEAYNAQNSFSEFFGLAQIEVVDSIRVFWPSGIVDVWGRIPVNQHLHLVEGTSRFADLSASGQVQICSGSDTLVAMLGEWNEVHWFNTSNTDFIVVDSTSLVFAEVRDSAGNRFLSDSLHLEVQMPPVIAIEMELPSCFDGNDGSITLNGVTPMELEEIVWSDPDILGLGAAGLSSGEYFYSLKTVSGCQISDSIFLSQPDSLTVELFTGDNLCAGATSGSVAVVTGGGVAPYTIVADTEADLSQLPAGMYSITITDANGCMVESEFVIQEPDSITVVVSSQQVLCYGESSGTVALDISGGAGSYDVLWNGLDSLHLAAGEHQITVVDANGCASIVEFEIAQPEPLDVQVQIEPVIEGVQQGSAMLSINGGTEPYGVVWSEGNDNALYVEFDEVGAQHVLITDANGCVVDLGFEIEMITGIENNVPSESIIYPNPVDDKLFFSQIPGEDVEVFVLDVLGRNQAQVLFFRSEQFLDVSKLAPGDYQLILKSNFVLSKYHFIKR
jgi:hypothetical protein